MDFIFFTWWCISCSSLFEIWNFGGQVPTQFPHCYWLSPAASPAGLAEKPAQLSPFYLVRIPTSTTLWPKLLFSQSLSSCHVCSRILQSFNSSIFNWDSLYFCENTRIKTTQCCTKISEVAFEFISQKELTRYFV